MKTLWIISVVAEATVTHNPPCIPECSVCYPLCEDCGLVHVRGRHDIATSDATIDQIPVNGAIELRIR